MKYYALLVFWTGFLVSWVNPLAKDKTSNDQLYHDVDDMIGASWMFEDATLLSADVESGKWSNGIVAYVISDEFTDAYKLKILEAMKEIESVSCIRFQPYDQNEHGKTFVRINRGSTCQSTVGINYKGSNLRRITLNDTECGSTVGVIIHELLHTLGFEHEHQRRDQNEFIEVHFENIVENGREWYNITNHTLLQTPYDYGSIMHYGYWGFTEKGNKTFTPKKDLKGKKIGQRNALSKYDIVKINRYYECFEKNAQCNDTLLNCEELSMQGWYCEKPYEKIVLKNCAKTCGMCRYFEKPSQKVKVL